MSIVIGGHKSNYINDKLKYLKDSVNVCLFLPNFSCLSYGFPLNLYTCSGRYCSCFDAVSDTVLAEQDLHILTEILRPAAPQWKTIGLHLGFLFHELMTIEHKPLLIPQATSGRC